MKPKKQDQQQQHEQPACLFAGKIPVEPKLKRVTKAEQRQQILPGLQVGKQLTLL